MEENNEQLLEVSEEQPEEITETVQEQEPIEEITLEPAEPIEQPAQVIEQPAIIEETIEQPAEGAIAFDDLKDVIKNALSEYAEESDAVDGDEEQINGAGDGTYDDSVEIGSNVLEERTGTQGDTSGISSSSQGSGEIRFNQNEVETAMYNAIVRASQEGAIVVNIEENTRTSFINLEIVGIVIGGMLLGWLSVYFALWSRRFV